MDLYAKSIDVEIKAALKEWRLDCGLIDGRLMALELIAKAGAGFYNSHTEEGFLRSLKVLRKDRTPNKRGRTFVCGMVYIGSNDRPPCFYAMREFRK